MVHPGIPTGVHVLCESVAGILLMRRSATGFFDGLYSLPGGHVEPGESVRQAAARELGEETGLEVAPAALSWLGVVHRRSDTNRIDFFVRAQVWHGDAEIREPDKCDQLVWSPRSGLPTEMVPYVRTALEAGDGPWVLELGWS